jgi:HPt (histidine-containing phosphotransfer) domain-containing protein
VFFEQGEESLKILAENCEGGVNVKWVEEAHRLKGSAGMIGATRLHALSAQAQKMEDAKESDRQQVLQEIRIEYETVKEYLGRSIL